MLFYHATFSCYQQSILEKGLILPTKERANWEYQKYIYLADEGDVAISMAEAAQEEDDINKDIIESAIICFEIDLPKYFNDYLYLDNQNLHNYELIEENLDLSKYPYLERENYAAITDILHKKGIYGFTYMTDKPIGKEYLSLI